MQWLVILLMAALLPAAPGYVGAQSVNEGTPASSSKTYTAKERQAYQQKVASDLDSLQQQINELIVAGRTLPQTRRTSARAALGLQKQISTARVQLDNLEKASEKDWGNLKTQMDKTLSDLTKAVQAAEASREQ